MQTLEVVSCPSIRNSVVALPSKEELWPAPPRIKALHYIAKLRGGSQPHLIRCSDDKYYVVKFLNNPQANRILANELLAHQLASFLSLPMPSCAIVEVGQELIDRTPDLSFELKSKRIPCQAGLAFGSQFRPLSTSRTLTTVSGPVANLTDFMGFLVFDKWTCNTDGRQVLFDIKKKQFRALMIDNGWCFNAEHWTFPDSATRGLYPARHVYNVDRGIDAFEPWLTRLENMITHGVLEFFASRIPAEWFDFDYNALSALQSQLYKRRVRIRELLTETIEYLGAPSPTCMASLGAA